MHTVLVLGGYGFFGSRIARALSADAGMRVLVAGRDLAKARETASRLGLDAGQAHAIDAQAPDLARHIERLGVDTVIHTAGPFQGQDYAVARAAIAAGAHYIDLADGREFVAGIASLDALARERNVLVTSGASSIPALSSAVVDRYAGRFRSLDSIEHGIGSGAKSPGQATMEGVFSYCGKPFTRLEDGCWKTTYGWLDMRRHHFPEPVGTRLMGSLDVPDLVLFPARYPGVRTVRFHAGFASAPGHLFVWAAAQWVRWGLVRSLAPLVRPLHALSRRLEPWVSDKGAMHVTLEGTGLDGLPLRLQWHLIAGSNHGPHIPCGASIALARKLARGNAPQGTGAAPGALPRGAMPCMGLLTVADYLGALQGLNIHEIPA